MTTCRAVRALRRRLRQQRGFTLVEMVVTIAVAGLLGAAVATVTIAFQRADQTTSAQDFAATSAEGLMDRLEKDIHTATVTGTAPAAFAAADATSFSLYSDVGDTNGPRFVHVYVTGGPNPASLHEDYTLASTTGTYTGVTSARVDTKDLNNSGGQIFTYYDRQGNVLAAPLSSSSLTQVTSVGISLTVQVPGGHSKPVSVSTRVYVRDAEYQ